MKSFLCLIYSCRINIYHVCHLLGKHMQYTDQCKFKTVAAVIDKKKNSNLVRLFHPTMQNAPHTFHSCLSKFMCSPFIVVNSPVRNRQGPDCSGTVDTVSDVGNILFCPDCAGRKKTCGWTLVGNDVMSHWKGRCEVISTQLHLQ
jgi:hypothetical protein